MKRLLMVAYHFPPFAASSGIQRTLGFARHLPEFGWEPLILTAHPRAYEHRSSERGEQGDTGMVVERAFALDASQQLSVRGRYPAFMARPDRWVSWWLGAVPKGLAMIRKYRPQAIWSTYPIATAHKIGRTLQRLSGLPWIADFRDPMAQDGYPADARIWQSFKRIEEAAMRSARQAIFVTPGAARMYRERYGDARIAVIENGYDEESFKGLDGEPRVPLVAGKITLLHSGVVYPSERDPTKLFSALRRLRESGLGARLHVRLRGPGHEALLNGMLKAAGVAEMVELVRPIPYRAALSEMMRADGLLVLQAANCNDQVPAKVYEYLRTGRPIVALTDPLGDTASLLRTAGVNRIGRLDSEDEIVEALQRFMLEACESAHESRRSEFSRGASRLDRTRQLVRVLEESLSVH